MGEVRYLGFSNWSAWKAATAVQMQKARGWAQFSSGQMYYSLVGRDVESEIAPFMRYAGLGMTVWSPLAGGFLSGKYTRENLKDSENRLAGFDFLPFDKDAGFKVVEKMRDIAERHGASVAQSIIMAMTEMSSELNQIVAELAQLPAEKQAVVREFILWLKRKDEEQSPFLDAIDEFMDEHPELLRRLAQ